MDEWGRRLLQWDSSDVALFGCAAQGSGDGVLVDGRACGCGLDGEHAQKLEEPVEFPGEGIHEIDVECAAYLRAGDGVGGCRYLSLLTEQPEVRGDHPHALPGVLDAHDLFLGGGRRAAVSSVRQLLTSAGAPCVAFSSASGIYSPFPRLRRSSFVRASRMWA